MVPYLACVVCSLKSLSNKHLKVVVVPWNPFLVWKCPSYKEYTDWWGNLNNTETYYGNINDTVYYAEIPGTLGCPNGEDRMYSGILWEFLMFMKQARNLSYTIVGIDDAWWGGTCFDSNNCTGMIGRVNRHEADIALGLY